MAGTTQRSIIVAGVAAGWNRAAAVSGAAWSAWDRRRPCAAANVARIETIDAGARSPRAARLEAALFVAGGPLTPRKLAQFALLADVAEVREVIDELNAAYDADRTPFRVERVASGFQLLTRAEYANWLDKLHQRQAELKLSPPAMETLTLIAYRQPITRADIEAVRGVQCTDIIKHLLDRALVKIGGEDDSLGRPYLYVTTRKFLELFGLRSLDDLPMPELRHSVATVAIEEPAAEEDEPLEATDDGVDA